MSKPKNWKKSWSTEDITYLLRMKGELSDRALARKLGRTAAAIRYKFSKLMSANDEIVEHSERTVPDEFANIKITGLKSAPTIRTTEEVATGDWTIEIILR